MNLQNTFIVIGLGYGDEGKGSWVDYLVRKHNVGYVVRFNGGSQAGHNVVSPEGITHCFSQFGSGTLVPETKTCLSHYILVNPRSLLVEAEVLKKKGLIDVLDRILVDENCPVITPFNSLLNKILEVSRGDARHGSCGCGVGLTQGDVEELGRQTLYVKDFKDSKICRAKLNFLWKLKLTIAEKIVTEHQECEDFLTTLKMIDIDSLVKDYTQFSERVHVVETDEILRIVSQNSVVFEGAQGVLLDSNAGFPPYITRSNTTFVNATNILEESGFSGKLTKVGLFRGYSTRHGAGPFVTEDLSLRLEPCHNQTNLWQGSFRLGWFDCVIAKYALDVTGGVDILALTNLDRMSGLNVVNICQDYQTDLIDKRFFECEDGQIQSIKSVQNLGYRDLAIRTLLLKRCVPVYREFSGWEDCQSADLENYLKTIEQFLEHEIRAISVSPTALGKHELASCSVV